MRFVLARPSNALNIGAAARAMANFGLGDLALVEPYPHGWRAARSGIYASELLKRAPVLSMEKALGDRNLVLGTASAHNRALLRSVVPLPSLSAWLRRRLPRGGRLAVLFGSERTGLNNEELDRCHAILRIPTAESAPSMNLGQAVALVAYELARAGLPEQVLEPDRRLVDGVQLQGLVDVAVRAMSATGVNAHMPESVRRQRFRRGLMAWGMSRADASWLRGLLERLLDQAAKPA